MRARLFAFLVICLMVGGPAFAQEAPPRVLMPAPTEVDAATTPAVDPDAAVAAAVEPAPADVPVVDAGAAAPAAPAAPVADAAPVVEAVPDAQAEAIVIPVVDPVDDPSSGDDVVVAIEKVGEAWHTKSFPLIAGAIVFLILTLFRLPLLGALTKKIPARTRILVAVGLSFLAAFFQVMATGVPWSVALTNVIGTSSAAVFANELFVESLLGKRYKKGEKPADSEKKPS